VDRHPLLRVGGLVGARHRRLLFIVARFIGGLGVGISTVAAPLYIAEIAPAEYRGRLAGMFQFNIVFGILVAFLSNALLGGVGENAWRWMLGVEAFPALLYTVLCALASRRARAG
jgi:MFS transporter, SP family, arabinose:H+ symporter